MTKSAQTLLNEYTSSVVRHRAIARAYSNQVYSPEPLYQFAHIVDYHDHMVEFYMVCWRMILDSMPSQSHGRSRYSDPGW